MAVAVQSAHRRRNVRRLKLEALATRTSRTARGSGGTSSSVERGLVVAMSAMQKSRSGSALQLLLLVLLVLAGQADGVSKGKRSKKDKD